MVEVVTLPDHLLARQAPDARELEIVITQLAVAGRIIARELARAGLVGQLGTTGDVNVQGEEVSRLDVWGNNVVVNALEDTGLACTLVSEEMEAPFHLDQHCARGRFVVCFDPVDGSSNLDVNGVVGTIFSVRRRSHGTGHVARDAAQAGTAQVAAGYIMYGPATLMLLTTGEGVDGFTLGPTIGEFVRSHPGVRVPPRGRIYSANEGNYGRWEPGVRRYVDWVRATDGASDRPYSARYAGSLVADVHRTLLKGGIFLYPADASGGKPSGKLRLQYEAAPMGFLAEQAGGRASTGTERVMDIQPDAPHQRVPLIIGSPDDVALAEDFIQGRR